MALEISKKKGCTIFVLVMRLSSFVGKRASRGERKTAYPTHNHCPINFVIGGFPLTATITVVEGGWRPLREDVRARSSSSLLAARHLISTTSSIVVYSSCTLTTDLSFTPFLFRRSLFIPFFPGSSLIIISCDRRHATTTYYTRTSLCPLEISSFDSAGM